MADLPSMRRSYDEAPLEPADLAPTWLGQLQAWLDDAVAAGIPEPNAMVLATASAAGRPSARTVLLKGADEHGLAFFTNLTSRKGTELHENARAAALFPWIALERQVIAEGTVELLSGAESDAYFASRPRGSRLSALASAQSSVIGSRVELEAERAELEARYPQGQEIPRPQWWGGLRIVPEMVEFWQGRPDRLHDRLRYRHVVGEWKIERLAP